MRCNLFVLGHDFSLAVRPFLHKHLFTPTTVPRLWGAAVVEDRRNPRDALARAYNQLHIFHQMLNDYLTFDRSTW